MHILFLLTTNPHIIMNGDLTVCVGRLLFEEETIFDVFFSDKKIKELLVEFEDFPRCYSMNHEYKRKYIITKTKNKSYLEFITNSPNLRFCAPTYKNNCYCCKFGSLYPKKLKPDMKCVASYYNCEFVDSKDQLCLQIMMSPSRNTFYVTYNKKLFCPEDIIDICGQVVTHSDI